MIISVNWLKQFTDIDLSVDELASLIGERLVEIESVIDLTEKYKDVRIVRVVECAPLEGSDHLNVTKIDDGRVVEGVERDSAGLVQVVCGAPNVKAGMLVAWLPPKSIVPETYGSAEPFELSAKALRGVMSNGMIASARELDLYDEHEGILPIDIEVAPGASFAETYQLNDYLLDIENKSLTHRPDTFGLIGFAREVAGIQGKKFETPAWLLDLQPKVAVKASAAAPAIHIEDPSLSARFEAIVLEGVDETAESPLLLRTFLARSGVRPINASVDISNYLMLLTGQPSHAYDYDKVVAVAGNDFTIRVRLAREGEKLTLLDGKEITLDPTDIVVAAGETPIGLGGIMGAANTTVDASTKRILFEAATFDLYHMRSTQMRHGIFSEAVTRFTKGIPAPLATPVIAYAVDMLQAQTGAVAASEILEDYPGKRESIVVQVAEKHLNETLGTQFSAEDIVELLENVGFAVTFDGLVATVTVPYWREDIHIPEDIIEEVGRLAGYDTIPMVLPLREFIATKPSSFDQLRSKVRGALVRAGANEVLTYSFVHGDTARKVGQDPSNAYRIINSLSPELQYYRQSLVPSLLANVHPNVKAGYESFALFELNKVHLKSDGVTEENVPVEVDSMGYVVTNAKAKGSAYYEAKKTLEYVSGLLGLTVTYAPLVGDEPSKKPFEPKRSAMVSDAQTGIELGVIGEFRKPVQKAFKTPEFTAGFELAMRAVEKAVESVGLNYTPPSRYPGTERDICFQVAQACTYDAVAASAQQALAAENILFSISPVDIYSAEGSETKNITIRIKLGSAHKTLTAEEVAAIEQKVVKNVTEKTEGKVV